MDATELAELVSVLTSELQIGESLRENLENQRRAIISWDSQALARHVEQHEKYLDVLATFEKHRVDCLANLPNAEVPKTLGKLIGLVPADCIQRQTLADLQQRSRKLFKCLLADEQRLQSLKATLVKHLHDAMSSLVTEAKPLYDQTGLTAAGRLGTGLIHENA